MSINIEIRAGRELAGWPISSSCSWDLQLEKDYKQAVDLFADPKTELGEERQVNRLQLMEAVERLLPAARKLPGGFQIRMKDPLTHRETTFTGGGIGGVFIEGVPFGIDCREDYWIMNSLRLPPGKRHVVFPGRRGEHRRDTAEMHTDNMGVIKVEINKNKRSDLTRLLLNVKKFLAGIKNDTVVVVVG